MAELTAEQIAQRAFDLNLLDERQLQDVWGEFGRRNVSPEEFVQFVMRRELLTNFQLERMLRGERAGYFYGDYKVLYLIAGGSFARVYRAVHKDTKRIVALKVLRRRYSDSPEQTDHFCREGWVGVRLRHPNIVPVHEVYSKGLTHFLVMDFIEGENLREFLKIRKKLDPQEATRLISDLASALAYAMEQGVAHRDLKLTNVLVSSRGEAKLVDFGLAATDASLADDQIGDAPNQRTIDYAGLERATGVRKDDLRSDIYFLGVLYYHMLYGKSPLAETRDRIIRLSRSRYVDVLPIHKADPSVPRVVATVVNLAMELDPARRYQSPGEMLVDLRLAAERLAAGDVGAADVPTDGSNSETNQAPRVRLAAALAAPRTQRGLLIVESHSKMQDIFRDKFKKAGYRVLVISDPHRAVARFTENSKPADCVVICSGHVGEAALDCFAQFAAGEYTRNLPVVLLLDESHAGWAARAADHTAPHRLVVTMPIKMKKLQELVAGMVSTPVA
jgi:serine/threonine-protein kinase